VTVLAESGSPMRDLTAADFVVKEGGRKLDVVDAKLSGDPLSVALLVDVAQQPLPPTSELRAGLAGFVKTIFGVNADAKIALVEIGSAAVAMVDFTSKADDLDGAIARLFFRKETGAVVVAGIRDAARQLGGRPGSRRAIVVVEFDSPEATATGMIQQAADAVANSGATLWAISAGSGTPAKANRDEVLDKMTKASGGKRYSTLAASGLEPRLKGIAATLTSQYLVTFNRAGTGALKPLTFETTRGAKVLATPFMR
jgi:hypothetical protein